jgi:NADPH:quinone reductase-like Zn-dependent oxidoreductase
MKVQKMKAIIVTAYGNYEVLELQQREVPRPKEKEILVKVVSCAATTTDTMMISGKPYASRLFMGFKKPKKEIPGTGFAGKVVSVGQKANRFKTGDEVFGMTGMNFSANAEYLSMEEEGIVLHKPENLPFTEACTFGDGHLTSINFLKELGKIEPGQKLLINGASGSLGTSAIQLAKYYGAEVTGVCSTANVGLVKSLGADFVIDYTRENFTRSDKKYDLIYDTIGKSSFKQSKRVLNSGGKYLSPVLDGGLMLTMLITSVFGSKKAKFTATGLKKPEESKALITELMDIFQSGNLKTVLDRQYPLEKVAQAHQYIASGRKKGNVAIIVES